MNKFLIPLLLSLMGIALSLPMRAQIETPMPSPTASFEQTLGLTTVSMEYSRPSAKGREVFGALVPYDAIWRTGANQATQITFGQDVKLEGKAVKAGTYAIYTIPGKKEWTVMLYSDLSIGGNVAAYDEEKESLRVMVKPQVMPMMIESMTFMLNDLRDDQANLYLMWEKTMISLKLELAVDEMVMASIEATMAGPSANDYFAAARYYYDTDRDLKQALTWIDQSLEAGERFWIVTWKARILTKMGNYKEAMATSQKAKELAQENKNMDYVRMNDELMAEIKTKM
jgi:tetratricopeptide (TPR) repeat protein